MVLIVVLLLLKVIEEKLGSDCAIVIVKGYSGKTVLLYSVKILPDE